MKKAILCLLVFLAACALPARPADGEAVSTLTFTPSPLAAAPPSVTPTPSLTPAPLPPAETATPPACDPFAEAFCISEGHFIFQSPILPPGNPFVDTSYRYGSTQNGLREPHHGVEFPNRFGTPVHAAGDGVVQFAGPDKEALYSPWRNFYGNVVVIRHANEMYTLYAHLSKVEVEAGQTVRAGELIGEVGQSGVATGSHLHFEVRQGGDGTDYFSTQNPEVWLMPNRDESGALLGVVSFSIVNERFEPVFTEFVVHSHLDKDASPLKSYFVVTYAKDMMQGGENGALGDLPPGFYRAALTYKGILYERWFEVQSGKFTQVVIVVK